MDSNIDGYGWDGRWSAGFASRAGDTGEPGRVVRSDRGAPLVATRQGLLHLPSRATVGPLAVGDWVVVEGGDVIVGRLERTSLLRRRDPESGEQLLAANVDVVAMVFGADRPLKAGRFFRTRTQIWDAGARPLVILTKVDLLEADDGVDALVERVFEIDPLLDVVAVSCVTREGLDELRRRISPHARAGRRVRGREVDAGERARRRRCRLGVLGPGHRPSRSSHDDLTGDAPAPGGGVLVDTPGLREVGLWTDESSVDGAFPEIDEIAERCHFRDCSHGSEPGCAVRAALEAGELSGERVDAWESLRREAAAAALRADEGARRAADRRFGRALKDYKQRHRPPRE